MAFSFVMLDMQKYYAMYMYTNIAFKRGNYMNLNFSYTYISN